MTINGIKKYLHSYEYINQLRQIYEQGKLIQTNRLHQEPRIQPGTVISRSYCHFSNGTWLNSCDTELAIAYQRNIVSLTFTSS